MLKKSVRQGGNRKLGGGKDVEGADAPEQLRKLQLQVIIQTVQPLTKQWGLTAERQMHLHIPCCLDLFGCAVLGDIPDATASVV